MITLVFAESNDHWVRSSHATNYTSARNGANRILNSANNTYYAVGQTGGSHFYVRQAFIQFQYAHTAGHLVNSAEFRFRNNTVYGSGFTRNTNIYKYDFNTTPTINNWRDPTQLNNLVLFGRFYDSQQYSAASRVFASSAFIRRDFEAGSLNLRVLLATSRQVSGTISNTAEYNTFSSTRGALPPSMVVGSIPKSRMANLIAAQIQLSDGSWFYLKRDVTETPYSLSVHHMDVNGNETTVHTFSPNTPLLDNDNMRSVQGFTLARDNNDNVYMADPSWETLTQISVKAFRKQSGNNWIIGPNLFITTPAEPAPNSNTQQLMMKYHNVAGGRLVIFGVRDHGRTGGSQVFYLLLDAQRVYNGQAGALMDSGQAGPRGFVAQPSLVGRLNPVNATGTLVDMCTEPSSSIRGYLVAAERNTLLGETGALSVGRYSIHVNGSTFNASTFATMDSTGGFASYDPEAKCRVLSVGNRQICKLSVDDRTGRGLTIDRFDFTDAGTTWTRSGSIYLDEEEISSFPSGSALAGSLNWDAIYFPQNNTVQIYYLDDDSADNVLMRTSINMNTMLATQSETVVDTIGTSSDVVHGIRVQRNEVVSDSIMITATYEDTSNDHHYEHIVDRINLGPTQPLLGVVNNFDASVTNRTFPWTFRDDNLADEQTAYELEIVDASDFSPVHSTGKVSSGNEFHVVASGTIPNNESYMWRVRTWDIEDVESPWSDYGTFATSSTGVVDIIDPDMDNDPDIFTEDYLVRWDLSGAAQHDYRILVTRTEDDSTFFDSGWVTSGTDEHLLTSLESDVEYLIEVTTRASMVESIPGYRLLTTHFSTVEEPLVTLQTHEEYIQVSVHNPEPRGDRPAPTVNQIFRRRTGVEEPFLFVGTCEPNETFRDYTAASHEFYEYKARAGVEI